MVSMKTLLNNNIYAKNYIKELNDKFGIILNYGDTAFGYAKPLASFVKREDKGFIIIDQKDDVMYYHLTLKLPDSEFLASPVLVYSNLHSKYAISGWSVTNNKINKELIRLEYIHEDSVKELLKIGGKK